MHTHILSCCHCVCLGWWWLSLGGPWARAIQLQEQWCPWFITHTHVHNTASLRKSVQYMAPSWSSFQPLFSGWSRYSYLYRNESRNKLIDFVFLYKGREKTWLISLLFFKLSLRSHFRRMRSSVSIIWQTKKSSFFCAVSSVPQCYKFC